VDGTGSGSCPVAGFGNSGLVPSGSATIKILVRDIACTLSVCIPVSCWTWFSCCGFVSTKQKATETKGWNLALLVFTL
jgi:hypothetical protein